MTSVTQTRNRLGEEKSPYLLQHRDNPVHWYPWGKDAFFAAAREDKPIFLSIGYSTCYWCHVMEKDSFETEEVARVLNEHFISIKVDREELPDVDKIYMDAVVAMSGHGGWPMSMFLMPDLRPFFGATFFWRPQFISVLQRIAQLWKEERENVVEAAANLTGFLARIDATEAGELPREQVLDKAFAEFAASFDSKFGGFGSAPKFPRSEAIALLLRIHCRTGNARALDMASITLDRMARGGIYDHLGGGFHRYSVDAQWLVPHFEKMLYDNALLATAYLEGHQVTGNTLLREVARETLDYVLRDMTATQGGFFSAEDAGEPDHEGEYYVWRYSELQKLLTAHELNLAAEVYGVSENGNFEHANILHLNRGAPWEIKREPHLQSIHHKLLEARARRLPPHKDDKILTSWNALMINAFCKGYQVIGDERYLQAAQRAAAFIRENLFRDGRLLRRYRDGQAAFRGYLDDYAFMIQALLSLYESDFNAEWIDWARALQEVQDREFWDDDAGGYFHSAAGEEYLIVRKKELTDGATPSGNSMSALNLLRLYGLTGERTYLGRSDRTLGSLGVLVTQQPSAYCGGLNALDYRLSSSKEVAIVGDTDDEDVRSLLNFLYRNFLPHKVVALQRPSAQPVKEIAILTGRAQVEGKPTFYVCENQACKLPTTSVKEAQALVADCGVVGTTG